MNYKELFKVFKRYLFTGEGEPPIHDGVLE